MTEGQTDGQMNGRTDGRMNGLTNGWTYGWTDTARSRVACPLLKMLQILPKHRMRHPIVPFESSPKNVANLT